MIITLSGPVKERSVDKSVSLNAKIRIYENIRKDTRTLVAQGNFVCFRPHAIHLRLRPMAGRYALMFTLSSRLGKP